MPTHNSKTEYVFCCFSYIYTKREYGRGIKLDGSEHTYDGNQFLTSPYSSLAQSVERMTVNHDVAGSSPAGGANKKKIPLHAPLAHVGPPTELRYYAPLAQLVEQLTLNQWVPGSNP